LLLLGNLGKEINIELHQADIRIINMYIVLILPSSNEWLKISKVVHWYYGVINRLADWTSELLRVESSQLGIVLALLRRLFNVVLSEAGDVRIMLAVGDD